MVWLTILIVRTNAALGFYPPVDSRACTGGAAPPR